MRLLTYVSLVLACPFLLTLSLHAICEEQKAALLVMNSWNLKTSKVRLVMMDFFPSFFSFHFIRNLGVG